MGNPGDTPADDSALFDASGFFADDAPPHDTAPPVGEARVGEDAAPAGEVPTATPARVRFRPSRRAVAIGAGVAVAMLGGAATVAILTRGDASAPGASASPTASPTAAPAYGARLVNDAWTVDWNATFDPAANVVPLLSPQAPASFDDGLSDADLGAQAPRNSPRFPPSYVATDAIWDKVGPGWGVAVFGPSGATYLHQYAGFLDVPAELYLVSPEGHYFRMWSAAEPEDDGGWTGTYNVYTITGVYPELGWISLAGYPARAESETPGFDEVRDLRTGAILAHEWAGGEGDSRNGTSRQVVGPLADGSWFWADILTDNLGSIATASATLVDAEGKGAPITLPEASFYGAQFTSADAAGTTIAFSGGGEFYGPGFLYLYDVATGEWRDATDLVVGPDRACSYYEPNDDASFYAICDESSSYALIGYDGSMTPVTQEAVWASYVTAGWEGTGFDPAVAELGEGYGDVTSFRDVSSGSAREVLTDAQCGGAYDLRIDAPVSLGSDRYAFRCAATNLLAAYDRATGATFALSPGVFPDTGARSGLADFVAFPTVHGGPVSSAAPAWTDPPGTSSATLGDVMLLSAPAGGRHVRDAGPSVGDYPDSTPLTPNVLDRVGDLWRIESYGPAYGEGATSVYLTSPEGTRYLALTGEQRVTPVAWDRASQRVLLSGDYGDPPVALDLTTGTLMAPYSDAAVAVAFRDGRPVPVGLGGDGRYYWLASADPTSNSVAGVNLIAWSGANGAEIVAILPGFALDGYQGHPLSPDGRYLVYQVDYDGQAHWVDLLDPTRSGSIGSREGNDFCYLDTWKSPTTIYYGCGKWHDDVAVRVWDVSQGKDVGPAPVGASVPAEELAAIYDSFQVPGTPLVIRTDGRDGHLVGTSVLTTGGLADFGDLSKFSGLDSFIVGQVDEVRPGTYLLHEGMGTYGNPGGDRVIVIDAVAGLVLTPDLPPPPGPDYARALTASVLVYLADAASPPVS